MYMYICIIINFKHKKKLRLSKQSILNYQNEYLYSTILNLYFETNEKKSKKIVLAIRQ